MKNYKEFGVKTSGGFRRNIIVENTPEAIQAHRDRYNNTDVFATVLSYDNPDIRNANKSGSLYFDLDGFTAQEDTKKLVDFLTSQGCAKDSIHAFYSGNKGFHVEVPFSTLGVSHDKELNKIYKIIASQLKEKLGLQSLDTVIYDDVRLFRLPNSINGKSGLYKIPLYYEELALPLEAIKEMASSPRQDFEYQEEKSWSEFSALYEKVKLLKDTAQEIKEPLQLKDLVGIDQGSRDNKMLELAESLLSRNYNEQEAWNAINEINRTYNPPLDAGSMERIFRQAVKFISSQRTASIKTISNSYQSKNFISEEKHIAYPQPLAEEAYYGIAGKVVSVIKPHTESDPVALLVNFLAAFGNVIGDSAHCVIEARKHPCKIFACLVGKSSKARKGTSWGQIERLFEVIDSDWKTQSGLSSGEGLIWSVRDQIEKVNKKGETEIIDPGIQDKRLLLVEPEFSSVLQVMSREKNTLSSILRKGWESGNLQTMTKNSPAKATGAHISILAHITEDELLRLLTDVDTVNGFGNRFLWFCVKRSQFLPRGGGDFDITQDGSLIAELNSVVNFAKTADRIEPSEETWELWDYIYPKLSSEQHGIFGAMVGRTEAYARRLSTIYALLDKSTTVHPKHLIAALAILDYVEASIRYIFQDRTGDAVANKILTELKSNQKGLTLTEINDLFGRHQSTDRLNLALDYLVEHERVQKSTIPSSGRNITLFSLNSQNTPRKVNSYVEFIKSYIEKNGTKHDEISEESHQVVTEEIKKPTSSQLSNVYFGEEAISKLITYGVLKPGQTTCQNGLQTTAEDVWVSDGNGGHHWVKSKALRCNQFLFWQVENSLPLCSTCNPWQDKYEETEITIWYQTIERNIQKLGSKPLTYAEEKRRFLDENKV